MNCRGSAAASGLRPAILSDLALGVEVGGAAV